MNTTIPETLIKTLPAQKAEQPASPIIQAIFDEQQAVVAKEAAARAEKAERAARAPYGLD